MLDETFVSTDPFLYESTGKVNLQSFNDDSLRRLAKVQSRYDDMEDIVLEDLNERKETELQSFSEDVLKRLLHSYRGAPMAQPKNEPFVPTEACESSALHVILKLANFS